MKSLSEGVAVAKEPVAVPPLSHSSFVVKRTSPSLLKYVACAIATVSVCCAVLCCAVLCCAVLCCAVLCCAVLCCAVLCCAVLCCAVLCCGYVVETCVVCDCVIALLGCDGGCVYVTVATGMMVHRCIRRRCRRCEWIPRCWRLASRL